ncbi:hypothetical protein OS493_004558 [Desmophyllum pertusum]|uniref:Uncharacterized protein n=1 Tax=Desmophyllum pertusum TaxID=174260 RepID=A0A9X0CZ97_9CNID|nr:hypothetical protein OS493_004558 [Desmophyllum pertusum]
MIFYWWCIAQRPHVITLAFFIRFKDGFAYWIMNWFSRITAFLATVPCNMATGALYLITFRFLILEAVGQNFGSVSDSTSETSETLLSSSIGDLSSLMLSDVMPTPSRKNNTENGTELFWDAVNN